MVTNRWDLSQVIHAVNEIVAYKGIRIILKKMINVWALQAHSRYWLLFFLSVLRVTLRKSL